eukprot:m.221260 g.221260  ORF g.221260 m.221260 type:complete len:144 (-) comp15752_c0_seq1:305-736(-)
MAVDKEGILDMYQKVRDDKSGVHWAVFKYDASNKIVPSGHGVDYNEFLTHFTDDQRVYGFVRITSGDELSVRAKFVLITWVGRAVSVVKRAKVSTDKAFVKQVIMSYAKEILADRIEEIQYETVLDVIKSVGGANYGTGVREE